MSSCRPELSESYRIHEVGVPWPPLRPCATRRQSGSGRTGERDRGNARELGKACLGLTWVAAMIPPPIVKLLSPSRGRALGSASATEKSGLMLPCPGVRRGGYPAVPPRGRRPSPGQQHRPTIDADPEEDIRLLTQVLALVIARLAVELVGGEVEVPVAGHRQRVRPEHARVVDQRLEPA